MPKPPYSVCLALIVSLSACGGLESEPSQTAQGTRGTETAPEANEVAKTGWIVHERTDAMTDAIIKSARVIGMQEDGTVASLTFMCDPKTPDFEVLLVGTTTYLGSSGSNVGYRVDGGEPAYVSAMRNSSLHGVSIVNKPELIAALQSGGKEIVMQLIVHQLVMTFPLDNAVRAIDAVKAGCKAA